MKESDPLLPEYEEQNTTVGQSNFNKWHWLMFFTFGMGPSFNLSNAISLDLPYFERTQPEGLDLAAWIGLAATVSAGISAWVALYFGGKVAGAKFAFLLIIGNFFIMVVVAFFWHVTIGGLSVFLLFGTLCGSTVGNLYYTMLVPWVASVFHPAYTSAFISGESFTALLGVVVQSIQNPGHDLRFSPTVYFLLLAGPMIFSMCCLLYIEKYINVIKSSKVEESNHESICPQWFIDKGLKYAAIYIWSAALSWWILYVILPFACASTDPQDHLGAEVLQWASGLGFGTLVLGNMLTSFLGRDSNFHLLPVLLAMTCLEFVIFLAMFNLPGNDFWSKAKLLLVADVLLIRLGFGYLVPLIYLDIARSMPKNSEKAGRVMTIWVQIASIFGSIIMFTLTVTVFKSRSARST